MNSNCIYCQAFPDVYTCSNQKSLIRDDMGKIIGVRECFYAYMRKWDEDWIAHPCPLFVGQIEEEDGTIKIVDKEGGLLK